MKFKLFIIFALFITSVTIAQFKTDIKPEPSVGESIISRNSSANLFLGFIDPANFSMKHSYSLSYMNFGSNSLALGVYTNSIFYRIADPLAVQLDVSVMHSPFSSYGKQMQNDLTGIYISKAQINWKPLDNFLITVQYRNMPYNSYYNPYNRGYYYDNDGFNDWYIGR